MPNKAEHVAQAQHNLSFFRSLDLTSTSFLDWAVTATFYQAVHWIEAYFAVHGVHSDTHRRRMQSIAKFSGDLLSVGTDLAMLKADSENARYWCYKFSAQEALGDQQVADRIESVVRPLI